MSSFDPSLVQRRSVKPEPADSRKEGKYICDNRQCSVVQAKINTLIDTGFQNGSKGISKNGTVQREPTEAEEFAKANRDRVENKYMALIGSDNKGRSDIAERLKAAPKDKPLPAYLSKYLVEKAGEGNPKWSKEENDLWMQAMIGESRNFILKHPEIAAIVSANTDPAALREKWFEKTLAAHNRKHNKNDNKKGNLKGNWKDNKRVVQKPEAPKREDELTGTWREVEKLLLNGNYKWDNKAGIFFHKETPGNVRQEAIDEEMSIIAKQNPGNDMAAAAGINHN